MRFLILAASVLSLAGASLATARETARPLAPSGQPDSAFPKPYRPVAEIISPIWATEEERDRSDEFGQVTRLLGLRAGQSVADIGAGSGYYTIRLSKLLGPSGRVYAEDVLPEYLDGLAARIDREGFGNVTLGRGEPHDPRLPAASLDAALLIHMYHEIAQPFGFLANLAPALRPGSVVGIVDLERATSQHGTPPDLLRCELAAVGYRQTGFHRLTGGVGYLATFSAPDKVVSPQEIKPCRTGRIR